MDSVNYLNIKKRNKNVFDVFYKQDFKSIKTIVKPINTYLKEENESNDLTFLTKIPKTNEFENIPNIEDTQITSVDPNLESKTKNESTLNEIECLACKENIVNSKPLNNLNIDMNENISNEKHINDNNLNITLIKEKNSDTKRQYPNDIIQTKNVIKDRNIKSNIFKKFKTN